MKYIMTLAFQLVLTLSLLGQKNVLIEKFTNIYCGSCPNAHLIIKDLLDQYPNAIWVNHHKPIDFDVNKLVNDNSVVLWEDFNVVGVPTAMIDRVAFGNSVARGSSAWRSSIEAQNQLEPVMSIEIKNVTFDIDSRTFDFDVESVFSQIPDDGDYRISVMMIEDGVYEKQHSYFNQVVGHPLEGRGDIIWDYVHSNVVRTILDEPWGTAGIIPQSPSVGESYAKGYSYTVPDEYKVHRFKIVAMVSHYGQLDITNAQVLNAVEVDTRELDLLLSVNEEVEAAQVMFSIKPNPAIDILNLEFQSLPDSLIILDNLGQQIQSLEPDKSGLHLNISDYKSGSYYLIAKIGEKQYAQSFVVIR